MRGWGRGLHSQVVCRVTGCPAAGIVCGSSSSCTPQNLPGLPPSPAGVIRVGGNGATQGAATSQACQASALELRMPVNGGGV